MATKDMTGSIPIRTPPPSSGRYSSDAGTLEEQLSGLLSSDQQFSVAAYLNLALQQDHDTVDLSQKMADLALQLQLQTQSCHEEIGKIGAELQAIVPRCSADIGRIGVGLEGLKMDTASLLESTSVDSKQEVSSSLETLSTLHALQANLTRTKEVLTAAATWDSTLSSIAPLLAQQNLTEAVNALAQLENGERALRGMPNPEEREDSITKVRKQVSDMLQPQLKHALANMNTRLAPLQQCVSLYSKLGKMEALKDEYVKIRPAGIHKAWFDYSPSYIGSSDAFDRTSPFIAWLPGWFDAVLSLITEERRQSITIFGASLVPEMVVKVLRECFRPILPSFQSRLESIYSMSGSSKASTGSLESICTIYESTLQFLSLSFESIASAWQDLLESGAVKSSGALALYQDVTAILIQVASPFVQYQQDLPQLEENYLGNQTQVAKEIRQAVTSVSGNELSRLQQAIDQLQGYSREVFPLVEGAVARFEVMNGGYGATKALSAIDRILAAHSGELTIAIQSLSAAMTADEKQLADNFDEPHVLCALDILKVAGVFRRQMASIESKTRERLGLLAERMAALTIREKETTEATIKTKSSVANVVFTMPDSMSAVEIDSLVTRRVCGSIEGGTGASYAIIHRLAIKHGDTVELYPEGGEGARRLAASCHVFVFDVCSSVPRFHLSMMSSLRSWVEPSDADSFASYGTLPQAYVTQVGEHMLALVQALEPFASDQESLALANEVMDGVRNVASTAWRDFCTAAGSRDPDNMSRLLLDGRQIIDHVMGHVAVDDEDEPQDLDDMAKASAGFCNKWLDVVGLAVTARLLERIMRIPSISAKGCEHLNADLNYLANVFSALGVSGHPHPLLGHIAEIVLADPQSLGQQLGMRDRQNPIQAALRSIEERVLVQRGIA